MLSLQAFFKVCTLCVFCFVFLLQVIDGEFTLDLDIDAVITLTTLNTGNKGSHPSPPPVKDFPLPYMENFES
jgi:hypothetical protein